MPVINIEAFELGFFNEPRPGEVLDKMPTKEFQ